MTTTTTIRMAQEEDIPGILLLLMDLRGETFWREAVSPNFANAEDWILSQGRSNPHFIIMVAESGEEVVGLCGAQLITHPLAPGVLFLSEWAWYVRPEERATGLKFALWRQVRAWAKGHGAVGTVSGKWTYWGNTWEA